MITSNLFSAHIHNAAISTITEVEYWLEHGAAVNDRDEDGNTPLHYALFLGKFEIIRYLVEHKANVNAVNKWGETPMSIAIHYKYFRTVTYLKHYGAYD